MAIVDLNEPASVDELCRLGALLGSAVPELDPVVQPYVEAGVVLNLISDDATDEPNLAPFSTNSISLHTESSGHRADEQPRFIILMCVEPGSAPQWGQTILVSMASVAVKLTQAQIDVLGRTYYSRLAGVGPPIVRVMAGRRVFSFRDFGGTELQWETKSQGPPDGSDVNAALRALLDSMYTTEPTSIRWARGRLAVIDNSYFFHGRSRGFAQGRPRHLVRLRILSTQAFGGDKLSCHDAQLST